MSPTGNNSEDVKSTAYIKSARTLAILVLMTFALMPLASSPAFSQQPAGYPSRLVRIVVPYSPGIGVDIAARTVAPKLSERLGQPVIVENKAGASGLIGTEFVARAAPDGYTLAMVVNTLVITAATRSTPFDPVKDFAPIIKVGNGAFLLTVNSSLPVRNLNELIAYAKTRPGSLNYGTPGAGTPAHLGTELLKQLTGIDLFHVPYKGMPPSVIGHANGDVAVMLTPVEVARPHLASGKLRALAATGKRRATDFPDLPTIAELGYPDFSLELWYGLLAPSGTPAGIVAFLNSEIGQLLGQKEIREALRSQSIEASPGTPAELGTLIRDDLTKWKKVVLTGNIRVED